MKQGDDFLEYISCEKRRTINLNDPMAWFSYDAMGLVTYGEDFGMVRARKTKKELADQQGALSRSIIVMKRKTASKSGALF